MVLSFCLSFCGSRSRGVPRLAWLGGLIGVSCLDVSPGSLMVVGGGRAPRARTSEGKTERQNPRGRSE